MFQLSRDEIRGLARIEREMDAGTQPYVVCDGHRHAFPSDVLGYLGVESGQTVSHYLLVAIMEVNILNLKSRMEREPSE